MDELFVKKDSKYHIIKEEDLGDTAAARLCGYENIEDAHLPRLKTLDFIKKLEGYYKESKKERAEKSAGGRRNNSRNDDSGTGINEEDNDEDEEGSEDNDDDDEEEDEDEREEDESTKEREGSSQSGSAGATAVCDDDDSDTDKEGRRRRNTVSKKYTRMVTCIRRCGVPSATVNAKTLRSSLAGLAKAPAGRPTESAAPTTGEDTDSPTSKGKDETEADRTEEEGERYEGVEPGDVVLRVTFYNKSSAKSQEFYVLGSQRLVELRDAIDCTVDHLERSNEANAGYEGHSQSQGQSQGASVKFFKSASFLIENVFYNDMRDSSNADYGKPVAAWAEKLRRRLHIKDSPSEGSSNSILGPYRSEDMSKTKFSDLNIRLGVSYAYLHQADCEHRFVFSEIHLVSKGDDTNRLHYPLVAFKVKSNCKKCDVCRMFPGVLITYDDRYAPQVPAYWCMECYNRFHFGVSGQKSYHYKALPYIYDFT